MAVKIGDVTIRIGATTKQLEADLKKADRALQASSRKFTDAGQKMSLAFTAPFAGLAAISVVKFDAQIQAIGQVEAALTSTGAVAGKTSEELQKSASALQELTTFGDEDILRGVTAQLLTFTNVAGEQFDKAQLAALNLSTRLGTDLTSQTIQLGKALNDPIKGITALGRAGIQFSNEQKETIKRLTETNQIAKAQDIILKELETQFGGSAEAAAKLGSGPIKQLNNQFGDLLEEFGKIISEAIIPFVARLKNVVTAFQGMDGATKKTIVTVAALVATIGPLLFITGKLISVYAGIVGPVVKMIASLTAQAAASGAAAAANTGAAVTTVAFGTALKATLLVAAPYVAIIGAIAGGIYLLYKNYQAADKAGSTLTDVQRESEKAMAAEKAQGDRLIKTINDESKSKQDKKKALSDLIAISPEYFKGLTIEKDGVKKINDQYNSYITNLKAASFARAAASKQDEIAIQILDKENRIRSLREEQLKIEQNLDQKGPKYIKAALDVKQRFINATILEIGLLNKESEGLSEIIDKNKQVVDSTKTGNDGTDTGISDGFKKQLTEIQAELANVDKLFKAGLITPAEQAQQKIKILEDRLKLLVTNGFKPQSKAVLDTKNQIQGLKDGQEAIIKPIQAFLQLINVIPGKLNPVAQQASAVQLRFFELDQQLKAGTITSFEATAQKVEFLNSEMQRLKDEGVAPTSAEFLKLSNAYNELATETDGVVKNIAALITGVKDLSDPFNDIETETFTELSKQITIIQDKTKAGLISDTDADVERINAIKSALNNLIEQGLGESDLAKKLQDQLKGIAPEVGKPFEDIFDLLGQKFEQIFKVPAGKGKEAAEAIAGGIGSAFSTLSQLNANREAELDQYYQKERALIDGSIGNEESKAAAIKALDEDVAKKKRAIARKQAAIDKASAIFSATVNAANAVVKALTAGPILGPILAGLIGGLAAAQIAAIAAAPLPSLAIGTDLVKSDGLAMIHKGEAIVPADVAKGGFSGGNGIAQVSGRIQGTDIILVSDYAMNFKNRIR